jgi:8-oxo-dGTP diphosphatase
MTTPEPSIPCVGAIVHDQRGRLLLVRRRNPPAAGQWSLPGGRRERGESDADAVRRELREETGLEVSPGAWAGRVVRGPYDIHDYHCVATGGLLRAGDDASEVRWVTRSDYDELDTRGALVDGLTATLRSWGCLPRA